MKTIEVKRQLLEEALDQLKRAQQDCYVPYTQNVIDELEVVFLQPDVTKSVTAVEWLIEQYENDFPLTFDAMIKAKAMEKEQIKDSFLECWKANVPDGIECKLDAEQYYNETFKSE